MRDSKDPGERGRVGCKRGEAGGTIPPLSSTLHSTGLDDSANRPELVQVLIPSQSVAHAIKPQPFIQSAIIRRLRLVDPFWLDRTSDKSSLVVRVLTLSTLLDQPKRQQVVTPLRLCEKGEQRKKFNYWVSIP